MSRPVDSLGATLATDLRAMRMMDALLRAKDLEEAHLRRITGPGEGGFWRRLDRLVGEGLVRRYTTRRSRLLGWALARDHRVRLTGRGRTVFGKGLLAWQSRLEDARGFPSAKGPYGEQDDDFDDDPREDEDDGGP